MMHYPISYRIAYIAVTVHTKMLLQVVLKHTKTISVIRFSKEYILNKEIQTTAGLLFTWPLENPLFFNGNHWKTSAIQNKHHAYLKVNVGLFRLCFEVLQFLQYVSEVVLQIFLQCNNVFSIHSKKIVHFSRGNWENSVTRQNLENETDK